ncbi:MAG: AAA family ATPase, partial [Candidatus Babeliales bacterium]
PEKYPFLAKTIRRSLLNDSPEISLNQLHQEFMINENLIKQFSQKTDRAGLAWWNIWYRHVDNYFIDPCKRYKIPRRTLEACILSLSYIYFSWHFEDNLPQFLQLPENFKNSNWFKKWMGKKPYRPYVNAEGNIASIEATNEGFINRVDRIVSLLKKGILPTGGLLTTMCVYALSKEWKTFKPFFNEKLAILVNKLKGGSYLKKANKLQGIIESVYFDDLVGLDHVKEFYQTLIDYLENPEPFDRLGIAPPKGCLLIGDTRTGKSYSARALLNELNVMLEKNNRKDEFKFLPLDASLIMSEGITNILSIVKEAAPCIVFIDEIDLLNLQRHGQNTMLMEFLTAMSGIDSTSDSKKQVIIIAATNQPETLDEALRTPGRFGKELRFEYPSFKERKEFIERQLNKLALNLESFDIDKLSQETEGVPYEGIKLLINQSILKARINKEMLTQQYLEETLDETIRNVLKDSFKDISLHEKELLSIHFAGHALALMLLDMPTKLASVTIRPVMTKIKEEFMGAHLWQDGKDDDNKRKRIEYGEVFTHCNHDTLNVMSSAEKLDLCKYYLAGIAAEKIINGSCSYSCHTKDKEKAFTLAKSLVFEGINVKGLPTSMQEQFYKETLGLISQCEEEIMALLAKHKNKLFSIVQELQERNMLNKKDIQRIIDQIDMGTTLNNQQNLSSSSDNIEEIKLPEISNYQES